MPQNRNTPSFSKDELALRHRPSGLNDRFYSGGTGFSGYMSACREMLQQAYARGATDDLEKRLEGNAPFELRPPESAAKGANKHYLRGVLLIHGLTDSPYLMHPLGAIFQKLGFRVMAVLLPGHGTQPGDLESMHWQEWARAVAFGVEQLAEEADEVYLAGYSAGAALAVRHSLLDQRVRGLFLFSPAFKVSPWAAWANLHKLYSWLWPAAKWLDIRPDADLYKYESFPKNAAYQMHALINALHTCMRGREVDIPVFAAASEEDVTVDSAATLAFMARVKHASSKLVYYTPRPGVQPHGIASNRVELVNSVLPEQGILGFSHLSILLPPEDRHYGRAGAYSNCLHYYQSDRESFDQCCRSGAQMLQGEVTAANLRAGLMRRLTYNPYFASLESSLRAFIEDLP